MKIPRDLKPGDRLWYSKTEYSTVALTDACPVSPYNEDSVRATAANGLCMIYYLRDGREIIRDTPPIIRIERIASAKKKGKADKAIAYRWAIRRALDALLDADQSKRIRAFNDVLSVQRNPERIARRLDGERKP